MPIFLVVLVLVGCSSLGTFDNPYPAQLPANFSSWLSPAEVQFHSRQELFRAPTGPLALGEGVRWRLKTRTGKVQRVVLVLQEQFIEGNQSSIFWSDLEELEMSKSQEPGWDVWDASYQPVSAATLGYFFRLENGSQSIWLSNNDRKIAVPWVNIVGTGGLGRLSTLEGVIPFGLTVYLPQVTQGPPQDVVYYYIFPDRFRNGNAANDPAPGIRRFYGDLPIEFHAFWNDPEPFKPNDGRSDNIWNNDFYGGDLDGIIQKLDHIASLGTTVIYLTPIFHAMSNHKYDTADYLTVDPMFGNLETFKKLVQEAQKRGMGVMLDASLNHSGADSIYFDRYGKWPGLGAFEKEQIQPDSPYYDWYEFIPGARTADQRYKQWADPSLAELKESEGWKDFAFRQSNSVSQFWLRTGAVGWRMDVTPWVSDEFWTEWRSAIRRSFPNALLISETWFVASKYLLGTMFDGTMNYVFRSAALEFAKGGAPTQFQEAFEMMMELYPPEALRRSMNLISSHDVPRALHQLGYRKNTGQIPATVRSRFMLAVALQYLLPGAPTIYYGDEVGVTGGEDPLNRGPFPWPDTGATYGDWSLLEEFRLLANLRKTHRDTLVFGSVEFVPSPGLLTFLRRSPAGKIVVVSLNNQDTQGKLEHPLFQEPQIVAPLSYRFWVKEGQ